MPRRRLLLVCLVAACGILLGELSLPHRNDPGAASLAALYNPYAVEPLKPYGTFREAVRSGDVLTLQHLAAESDGYLAYQASLELARWRTIDAPTRLAYYRRVLALRINDPLARDATRSLKLEAGLTAWDAGATVAALAYLRDALPLQGAANALDRFEPDRRTLAQDYLDARMYESALNVLRDTPDASIRAQAELGLGNYDQALPAYQAWVAEAPTDQDAALGMAWTLYNLKRYDEAGKIFATLPGHSAIYGHALCADKLGNVAEAVTILEHGGWASDLWHATTMLEAEKHYAQAIPLYLTLARGTSPYADDAAFRAAVLADRLGMPETAHEARALIPSNSFFSLLLGRSLDVPRPNPQSMVTAARGGGPDAPGLDGSTAAAIRLAHALVAVHQPDAAVGELLFALRTVGGTTDAAHPPAAAAEADVVAIAQALQSLGEYRQSVYAARELIDAGSRSLEVWRLAFPTAYAPTVKRQAAAAGVSPTLVWAVMRKESAFSPVAVSTSDAIGLMQVTPPTWDWLGTLQGDAKPADPFDPSANIRYGTYYLGYLLRLFHGDAALAVASYNRGQGYIAHLFDSPTVNRNLDDFYRDIDAYETREYMQTVLVDMDIYQALYPTYAAAAP